jgi:hypothetical protein
VLEARRQCLYPIRRLPADFGSPLAICLKVVFVQPDKRVEKGGVIMIKGKIIQDHRQGYLFEAEILTKEGSLADKLAVDKNTGWMRSIY